MKKALFLTTVLLSVVACSPYRQEVATNREIEKIIRLRDRHDLSVSFVKPTEWDGRRVSGRQVCSSNGGAGSTPPLLVENIPPGSNVIILEINDSSYLPLSYDGGLGKIGFYHDGSNTAWLLPVPGETNNLPSYAFREKGHRANTSRGTTYLPPCSKGSYHNYFAEIKAIHRTGEGEQQRDLILAVGQIGLGMY